MSSARPIKVLVIHDDPLTRAGLIAALGNYTDIEPVISEDRGLGASLNVPELEALFVDVLVADYANGIDVAERFTQQCGTRGRQKVMIVTANDSEWEIRSAIECGIAGYLLAGCPLDHLAVGVRTVHRGARYFSPGVTQRLAESLSTEPLTGREEAVLQLVVDGLCNKAIANRLGVALGTVKTHLIAIFDKLNVETRTQAVITVARRGLLRQRMHRAAEGAGMTANDSTYRHEAVSC
jgi:DNA-binding NarL/FixJ family response regulator